MKKLTPQQELFAQEYAKCGNGTESYKKSYPRSQKWADNSVYINSSKLLSNTNVLLRVKELQQQNAERNKITVDTLLAELEQSRQIAMTDDKPSHASAEMTKATMGKAKLLGLDKQVVDNISSDGSMSPKTLTLDDFYKNELNNEN